MRCYIILIILLLTYKGSSQNIYKSDSIYLYNISNNVNIFEKKSITFLNKENDFASIIFGFENTKGNLRKFQDSEKSNLYYFDANGYSKFNRFKFLGGISYNKYVEDSLANDLRGFKEDLNPLYFYANKPNSFLREEYKLNSLLSYELLDEKLYLGFGLDYFNHRTTGQLDPRPDIRSNKINYKAQLTYSSEKQKLGFGLNFSNGNETNEIMYKNMMYKNSILFPERFTNLSTGFGDIKLQDDGYFLERNFTEKAANVSYLFNSPKININFYSQYSKSREDNTLSEVNLSSLNNGYFTLNKLEIDLLTTYKKSNNINHQLYLGYKNNRANNYRNIEKGIKYTGIINEYNFKYLLFLKLREFQNIELGSNTKLFNIEKKDYSVANYVNNSNIYCSVFLNYFLDLNKNKKISFYVEPGLLIPISNKKNLSEAYITNYTTNIILPDFSYSKRNIKSILLELRYGNTFLKKYTTYFIITNNLLFDNNAYRNYQSFTIGIFL